MAAILNLDVTAGDDRTWVLTFTDTETELAIPITGWTLTADIRESKAASRVLGSFTLAITDGPNGVASFTLPKAVSAVLPTKSVYDLQADVSGIVRTYFEGTITTTPDVTK